MNTSSFRTAVRSSLAGAIGASTFVLGQSFTGLKPRSKRLHLPHVLNPAVVRIGKLAACLLLGVAMLPQSAHSTPNFAAAALADNPVGFWQLTETGDPSGGGLVANDSSGNAHNGVYGTTSRNFFDGLFAPQPPTFVGFTNGQGAVQTAATDANSPVSVPLLNLNTNTVTISMWINPGGGETAFAGLFMNRYTAGNGAAGLGFGGTLDAFGMAELGYTWNTNSATTYNFNSGLFPLANNWNFVVLVIQPTSATIYLCFIDGLGRTNVLSAVNPIAHTPEAFGSGNTWLGSDVTAGGGAPDATRVFSGTISDVAVYNSSLTSDQVLALFAAGLGVQGFPPTITTQPQSQYAIAGSKTRLTAGGVNGTSPISYQWTLNGTNISLLSDSANFTGANSNVLTILSPAAKDAGTYQLLLTNSIGFAVSSNATITIQATNLVGEWLDGSTAGTNLLNVSTFSLATNHGAYFVGGATYVFTNDVPAGKTGQSLFLYNGDTGLAVSNTSTLDPNYDDVFDNRIDNAITVTCWAKGWPANWNPFVSKYGETTPSPAGGWQLRADAGNHPCWTLRGDGGVDDMSATSLTFGNDGVWHFYAGTYDASTGLRKLYVDGAYVMSETNQTPYAMAPVEHLCIGARDANGSTIANFFTGELYDVRVFNYALSQAPLDNLYGQIPVSIVTQPKPTTTFPNSPAQFSVTVAGTPPLAYQWRLNGTNISLLLDSANFTGGNSNILTILSATAADLGAYSVTITNAYGGALSTNANLTIVPKALVGQWFNGTNTLAEVSGFQPPGTHDGFDATGAGHYGFTNDVPLGRTGASLVLSGGDTAIAVSNSSTLDAAYTNTFDDTVNGAISVAFWAKGYPTGWNYLVSKNGDSGSPNTGWTVRRDGWGNANGGACFSMRGLTSEGTMLLGVPPTFGDKDDLGSTVGGADGAWHHYCGVYSQSTGIRSLYVDTVLVAQETGEGHYLTAPAEHLVFGNIDQDPGNNYKAGAFLNAEFYDVRIYNYDLSSNEVFILGSVPDPSILIEPPAALTAYVGVSRSISFTEKGYSPLTNQWQFNGTNLVNGPFLGATIIGANSNVLTIVNPTTNLQGVFRVVVSDAANTTISSNSVLTVLSTVPAPGGTNIIGAWLAGSATLADVSGYSPAGVHDAYGITGTSTPTSSYGAFTSDIPPGMGGKSLAFTGTSGLAISNSSTLDASYTNTFDEGITNGGGVTVTVWAKGWPGQWNPWVSKFGESGVGWQLRSGPGNAATWTVRGTGGNDDMIGSINSNDGQWHNYTGTWNATTGERDLYVDGVLSATQIDPNLSYTESQSSHLALGTRDAGGNAFGNYYGGELYGVRIYDLVLTQPQINSLLVSTNSAVSIPVLPVPIRNGNQLVFSWTTGTLQQATNVTGPWSPTGATSPYTNIITSTNAPRMFYRLSNP
jgi:hypothetical protein